MNLSNTPRWEAVERSGSTLFLVSGGLLVGHAVLLAVQAFTQLTTPPDVFGPAGHLVALVGLLGLSRTLVRRSSTVARVAGVFSLVTLGGWTLMAGIRSAAIIGVVSGTGDVLPGVFFLLLFVATILTYLLFGVAIIRTETTPLAVGVLMLTPAVLLVVVLSKSVLTGVTALDGVVIGSGLAGSMLALGYTLGNWEQQTRRDVSASDTIVG